MKIERHDLPRQTIEAFADQHGLTMEVHERHDRDNPNRFYAHFKHCEVSEPPFLSGTYGDGRTPEAAIASYARVISGKVLVIDSYTPNRREIAAPILTGASAPDAPAQK